MDLERSTCKWSACERFTCESLSPLNFNWSWIASELDDNCELFSKTPPYSGLSSFLSTFIDSTTLSLYALTYSATLDSFSTIWSVSFPSCFTTYVAMS